MCMKFKQFTLFLAFFASVGTMFAEKVQIGNLYYNLKEDKTAEVTYDKYFNENKILEEEINKSLEELKYE